MSSALVDPNRTRSTRRKWKPLEAAPLFDAARPEVVGVRAGMGASGAAPPRPGYAPLSVAHISSTIQPKTAFTVAKNGNYARLRVSEGSRPKEVEDDVAGVTGAKRGKIIGFTRQSAARLRAEVNMIDQKSTPCPFFVTLTYAAEFETARASKADLNRFLVELLREYPDAYAIWKLEPQKRGAPHYHLVVFGCSPTLEFVASTWHRIAGYGNPLHLAFHLGQLKNRPCVEQAASWDRVNRYLSKYCVKLVDSSMWHEPGRFWGKAGKANREKYVTLVDLETTPAAGKLIERTIRRWHESQHRPRFRVEIASKTGPERISRSVYAIHKQADERQRDPNNNRPCDLWHLIAARIPADLNSPAARKSARKALAAFKLADADVLLRWCGRRRNVRGNRPMRTMLVPAVEAERLHALCQSNAADAELIAKHDAARQAAADLRQLRLLQWYAGRTSYNATCPLAPSPETR